MACPFLRVSSEDAPTALRFTGAECAIIHPRLSLARGQSVYLCFDRTDIAAVVAYLKDDEPALARRAARLAYEGR